MKSWKNGAVIGGIIGFLILYLNGLFFGAIIGGGLFLFFSSSKIKSWMKLMLIGAFWGVFSFLGALGIGYERDYLTLNEKIILMPMYISRSIWDINPDLFDLVPFIGPVIFGPIIVYLLYRTTKTFMWSFKKIYQEVRK